MKIIFAVDSKWNIGYEGDMLFRISKDLKRFKEFTQGNIIIMGRKTFESLPDGKALPNRINIIISKNQEYRAENSLVVNSVEELFPLLKELNPGNEKEEFLIGGGNLTEQMLKYCDMAYITKVDKEFEYADTKIPNLDRDEDWEILRESKLDCEDDLKYKYVDYIRRK